MTNTDSFISEVSDEVRRDRLFRLFRRYGWIPILAVILLVSGAAFNEWRKARSQTAAENFGDILRTAISEENTRTAIASLSEMRANDKQKALIALSKSQLLAAAGEEGQSLDELMNIVGDDNVPLIYRHLAELRSIWAQADAMPLNEQLERLVDLEQPGAPFRLLANETRAHALVKAGQIDEATTILRNIQEEAAVPPDLRQRVAELLATFEVKSDGDLN